MADYIPITDQEIEPEAPITSILHHKIRDNPIAMFEADPNAPKLEYEALAPLSVGQRQIRFRNGQVSQPSGAGAYNLIPGGIYNSAYEVWSSTASASQEIHIAPSLALGVTPRSVIYLEIAGTGLATYYRSYYFTDEIANFGWFYFLIEKSTGDIKHKWFSEDHCSLGFGVLSDHPFIFNDNFREDDFEIYVINLTKEELLLVDLARYTKTDGDFVTLSDLNSNNFEIDYRIHEIGIIEAFDLLFNINMTEIAWLSTPVPTLRNNLINKYRKPVIGIEKPQNVTRVGVTPK